LFGALPPPDSGNFQDFDTRLADYRVGPFRYSIKGRFDDTLPGLLSSGWKFTLAHVDCDIYSTVKYAVQAVKPAMQPGGYIIFDDPLHGSCLGAFDAVMDTLILEDRLHPEQVYPHMVFRYPPLHLCVDVMAAAGCKSVAQFGSDASCIVRWNSGIGPVLWPYRHSSS
jgi:hypothetical protein